MNWDEWTRHSEKKPHLGGRVGRKSRCVRGLCWISHGYTGKSGGVNGNQFGESGLTVHSMQSWIELEMKPADYRPHQSNAAHGRHEVWPRWVQSQTFRIDFTLPEGNLHMQKSWLLRCSKWLLGCFMLTGSSEKSPSFKCLWYSGLYIFLRFIHLCIFIYIIKINM